VSSLSKIEINLNNLNNNVKNLRSLLKPNTKFMSVVKSNAYGHGIIECAKASIEAGSDWLGVISLNEAILIREKLKIRDIPILVLGYVEPEDFQIAAENNISVAIVNWEQIEKLKVKMIDDCLLHSNFQFYTVTFTFYFLTFI